MQSPSLFLSSIFNFTPVKKLLYETEIIPESKVEKSLANLPCGSEVSAHLWSFVCVLLGPFVRLNIKAEECVEEEIGYVITSRNQTEEGTNYNV